MFSLIYDEERAIQVAREEAWEEGQEEKARDMARKLLANGVSPDIIARSAGLPVETIQNLMI